MLRWRTFEDVCRFKVKRSQPELGNLEDLTVLTRLCLSEISQSEFLDDQNDESLNAVSALFLDPSFVCRPFLRSIEITFL